LDDWIHIIVAAEAYFSIFEQPPSDTGGALRLSGGEINPTELIATLINQDATFEDGIEHALSAVEGSCSLLRA
jgi:hypothetical protein